MVPVLEMGPPVSPVPVLILVTVPPAAVLVTTTVPVPDETEIPEQATISTTPELPMMGSLEEPEIKIPGPAEMLFMAPPPPPVALMVPVA
jgi:hypothetical protein